MNNWPDFLLNADGRKITPADWERQREQMKKILQQNIYGRIPDAPDEICAEVSETRAGYCAGKALFQKILLTIRVGKKEDSFPVFAAVPVNRQIEGTFLFLSFRTEFPNEYLPVEEIVDGGFAVFSFCYKDVTADNDDFTDGLASLFYNDNQRQADDPGKIAIWAWAAMRVMDYLQTRKDIDISNIMTVGHSRLGKTALVAAGFDERFSGGISNDSGCAGAAITRGKQGERIAQIVDRFPYWFCRQYAAYAGREQDLPFDQHFLLALIAPRTLYVASAQEDLWADPQAEFAGCVAASGAYALLGRMGIETETFPALNHPLHAGTIGYHIRPGTHWLSRSDWQMFMAFRKK